MTLKSSSASDFKLRRRRALYRATHRGTQEMDFLLGRFAAKEIETMTAAEIETLERLIDRPDPEIEFCIKQGETIGEPALDELIERLRRFHGLAGVE
ncbi:MAG: succinate dehydrogenase assembly factor 2 [Methyloceanibacter sp.]|uniref:FAD assembly factor SdhE n=1 Tax=Methyloceanibacter sp. TaxID=1965321 RepID=UPI003D9B7947